MCGIAGFCSDQVIYDQEKPAAKAALEGKQYQPVIQ